MGGNSRPLDSRTLAASCRTASAPGGQRDDMLPLRLHAVGRDRPCPRLEIQFLPRRQPGLDRPACRQRHPFQRQRCRGAAVSGDDGLQGRRHVGIGQRRPARHRSGATGQCSGNGFPCRVVRPVAFGDSPIHDRPNPGAHALAGRALVRPQRQQARQHVLSADLVHRHPAEQRIGVVGQRRPPRRSFRLPGFHSTRCTAITASAASAKVGTFRPRGLSPRRAARMFS